MYNKHYGYLAYKKWECKEKPFCWLKKNYIFLVVGVLLSLTFIFYTKALFQGVYKENMREVKRQDDKIESILYDRLVEQGKKN